MSEKIDIEAVTQYEKATWGRCAAAYADTFAGLTGKMIPLLLDTAEVTSNRQALDIGCGPGLVADAFSQTGAKVSAIDFSPEMIEVAQQSYPHISFGVANAEQLPFESASFDIVVSNYVAHHFAQPDLVFSEISRVLKPGGRFVFAVWGKPEDQSAIGAFFGAVAQHHNIEALPHGPLFGVTERTIYEPLLSAAGLEDCQLSLHPVTWDMANLEPVINGFWDWGNLAELDIDTQDKIKATTIENAQAYKKDDGYTFPHSALQCVARKR